jgi:hypothetical protein
MPNFDSIAKSVSFNITPGVRLAYTIIRLALDIEEGFGRAIIDILKKQYPDQTVDAHPHQVGGKMLAIAKKQLQYNEADAMDSVQDFLTYISTGTEFVEEETEDGEIRTIKRKTAEPWNFRKDFDSWKEALGAIYSNIRRRSITKSKEKFRKKEKETGIQEAFGRRPEGGGVPEGGEGRIPDIDENDISKALDERAAVKEFYDQIGDYIPALRSSLSENTSKLFDLIFIDEVGSFGSDIKENMGQASTLKEKHPELYKANEKRWSGFVGDLRKQLLSEIHNFIENKLPMVDYETLYESFFSDVSPREIEKIERKKIEERELYQRGIDERKFARFKWMELQGPLSPLDQRSYDNLKKKLKKQGVNVDAIQPMEPKSKGSESVEEAI